jgi:Sigma-70 region 2
MQIPSYKGMRSEASEGSDADLIRAAGSDAAAFGALYERHALSVYGWCHRRLEWAASDLTAETFAQAWLSRDRFRDEHGGSALPWLLGIARNVLRETIRRDRVETHARERLGLPLDLAAEEGYARSRRGSHPAPHSQPRSTNYLSTSAMPSSCAWSVSCRTTRWPSGSRFSPRRHGSGCRALCDAWRP